MDNTDPQPVEVIETPQETEPVKETQNSEHATSEENTKPEDNKDKNQHTPSRKNETKEDCVYFLWTRYSKKRCSIFIEEWIHNEKISWCRYVPIYKPCRKYLFIS